MSSRSRSAGYWAGVLGTTMLLLGLFGVAYGWTTITVGEELRDLAARLHGNELGLAIGGIIHGASVGVLSLSGVETAKAAQDLLDVMPTPHFLDIVGYVRIGLSSLAVIIGFFLAMRHPWAIIAGAIWAVVSTGWFCFATWLSWKLLEGSVGHPLTAANSPLYLMNAAMHLLWPTFLAIWLVPACFRGSARSWKERL